MVNYCKLLNGMENLNFLPKTDHHASTVKLDCTLLVLAQIGVFVYGMFSILGNIFAMEDESQFTVGRDGLIAEILSLVQCSTQTLFILNAVWRRCRGAQQNRIKPGRETVTFLLVANMSMWFINCLIKGHASFRPTHLTFFGTWAWTIITHISMPLSIFYRFHSTICLFDIWKSAYKVKIDHWLFAIKSFRRFYLNNWSILKFSARRNLVPIFEAKKIE